MSILKENCLAVKNSSRELAVTSTEKKNKALHLFANALDSERAYLLKENEKDVTSAKENKDYAESFIERLTLNDKVIDSMVKGVY